MRKTILELSALPAISGGEHTVRQYLMERLKDASAVREMRVDRMGNLFVELAGEKPAPNRVMFAAHMDEVGAIVTGITENGYLRFATVGGILPEILFSSRVTVNGHVGVIGGKAVHQCSGEEKKKVPSQKTMLIDIGATNREEAEACVHVGDAVIFAGAPAMLGEGRFLAKALDDRAGCAILLALAHTKPQYDVTLVFTVQEEVGLRGAGPATFAVQPDIAVAVDATTAADCMGASEDKQASCIGSGGVVLFMDRRTMYDKALFDGIFRLAAEHHIAAQPKTVVAGGNDAGAMQTAGAGARVAAVSVPCRYIHSPSCVLDDRDVQEAYRLLEVMMNTLPAWDDAR